MLSNPNIANKAIVKELNTELRPFGINGVVRCILKFDQQKIDVAINGIRTKSTIKYCAQEEVFAPAKTSSVKIKITIIPRILGFTLGKILLTQIPDCCTTNPIPTIIPNK